MLQKEAAEFRIKRKVIRTFSVTSGPERPSDPVKQQSDAEPPVQQQSDDPATFLGYAEPPEFPIRFNDTKEEVGSAQAGSSVEAIGAKKLRQADAVTGPAGLLNDESLEAPDNSEIILDEHTTPTLVISVDKNTGIKESKIIESVKAAEDIDNLQFGLDPVNNMVNQGRDVDLAAVETSMIVLNSTEAETSMIITSDVVRDTSVVNQSAGHSLSRIDIDANDTSMVLSETAGGLDQGFSESLGSGSGQVLNAYEDFQIDDIVPAVVSRSGPKLESNKSDAKFVVENEIIGRDLMPTLNLSSSKLDKHDDGQGNDEPDSDTDLEFVRVPINNNIFCQEIAKSSESYGSVINPKQAGSDIKENEVMSGDHEHISQKKETKIDDEAVTPPHHAKTIETPSESVLLSPTGFSPSPTGGVMTPTKPHPETLLIPVFLP